MEKKVVYFEKPGKENTGACLDLAIEALNEGGYRHVVVASTTGSSGLLFSGPFKNRGVNTVVVTHSAGSRSQTRVRCRARPSKRSGQTGQGYIRARYSPIP